MATSCYDPRPPRTAPPDGTTRLHGVELTARQRRALEAICDTFLPRQDGLPSATELGVPQAIADALDANPRAAERKQTAQLLGLWDTALLTALGGGGFRRFSALPQERREE